MKDNQCKLGGEPEQTAPSGVTLTTKQKHTIEQFETGRFKLGLVLMNIQSVTKYYKKEEPAEPTTHS